MKVAAVVWSSKIIQYIQCTRKSTATLGRFIAENAENYNEKNVLSMQLTMDMDKDRMDEAMDLETALETKSS